MSFAKNHFEELNVSSPEVKELLWSSRLQRDGSEWIALPRSLRYEEDASGKSCEKLTVELIPRDQFKTFPKGLAFWMQTVRAVSLTATVTPGIAVLLMGLAKGLEAQYLYFILAVVGALLLQVAINIWNDVYDHLKLIDLPGTLGGSGVLQTGAMSARDLNRIAWVSFVLGVCAGIPVLLAYPILMAFIGGLAVLGVLGYSGPILNLKYRAMGDVSVFLLCGPLLTLGFSLSAFGRSDAAVLLLGAYFGFAAMAILHSNNLQDIFVDQKRGARTLATELGFVRARHGLWILYTLAWLSLAGVWALGSVTWIAVLVSLVALPLAKSLSETCLKASGPESGLLSGIRIKTAQLHLLMGLLLCVGFGIEIFILKFFRAI
jgi:1,4-dihydroxy-2-naphthoate octaprenyltransferase